MSHLREAAQRKLDEELEQDGFDDYVNLDADISVLDGAFTAAQLRKIAEAMEELEAVVEEDEEE